MNPSEIGSTSTRSGSGLAAVHKLAPDTDSLVATIKLLEDAGSKESKSELR